MLDFRTFLKTNYFYKNIKYFSGNQGRVRVILIIKTKTIGSEKRTMKEEKVVGQTVFHVTNATEKDTSLETVL